MKIFCKLLGSPSSQQKQKSDINWSNDIFAHCSYNTRVHRPVKDILTLHASHNSFAQNPVVTSCLITFVLKKSFYHIFCENKLAILQHQASKEPFSSPKTKSAILKCMDSRISMQIICYPDT